MEDIEENDPEEDEENQQAIEEAFHQEQKRSSKYSRHPYHYNLGKIANVYMMQLDLKAEEIEFEDELTLQIRPRKKLVLLHGGRVAQGGLYYCPLERALLAKRGEGKLHSLISKFASGVQETLIYPTIENIEKVKYLTSACKGLLKGYEEHHKGICGGGKTIRFEHTLAWGEGHEDFFSIPLDTEKGINPFLTLRCASRVAVSQDIQNLNQKTLEPLDQLWSMNGQTISSLSPEEKTMFVFLAEITQQRANSTDPGLHGIHRMLVKRGEVSDYERVKIPNNYRRIIAINPAHQGAIRLPFGLQPSCLPMIPKFDQYYNILANSDPSPGLLSEAMHSRASKLHNPRKFTLMQNRLKMLSCSYCNGTRPGMEVPGIMEKINTGAWLLLSKFDKETAVHLMVEWLLELYHDEFNYLLRLKLKRKRNSDSNMHAQHYVEHNFKETQ